jgi:hypothetical protein
MVMHGYKPPVTVRLPKDPLTRRIAQSQARRILSLRLEHRLSRVVVVERTGINWKRIRGLEEGSRVACLDELAKLASLYSVRPMKLIQQIMSPAKGAAHEGASTRRAGSRYKK